MASKMIGFRCPVDLAELFEQYCEGADKTSGEVLRGLVDDLIYPPSAELGSPEQLYGVKATELIVEQVNAQIKEQLKEQLGDLIDEHLGLVQIDRGLTEAEKEHYEGALTELESELAKLKVGVNKLVQTVNNNAGAYERTAQTINKNVELCGESFNRVSRLFQLLEAHSHDGAGKVEVPQDAGRLLSEEVQLADKRVGEFPVGVRKGKVEKPGWKYLEKTEVSVKKD